MSNKFGTYHLILLCVFLLINFLFFSGLSLHLFEKEAQPEVFGSITQAIGYVFLTFFTIGYSDLGSVTLGGKLICIAVPMIGSLLGVAIFIGIVVWIYRCISSNMRTRSNGINS